MSVYVSGYIQKKFTFRLRSTVEKRSVPFPLYGRPIFGTQNIRSRNGQEYGNNTVAERTGNGYGTEVWFKNGQRTLVRSYRRFTRSREKTTSEIEMTYRTALKAKGEGEYVHNSVCIPLLHAYAVTKCTCTCVRKPFEYTVWRMAWEGAVKLSRGDIICIYV